MKEHCFSMTVLILDAYNLLYRSFVSLPQAIVADDGRPINAVYGMVATMLRLLGELPAAHLIAAFDEPDTRTFRQELYPHYQAQRGPLGGDDADEFARQVGLARETLPRVGIPTLSQARYEADDVMGTLACRALEAGMCAALVSTDRDLLQLVRPGIEVVVPGSAFKRLGDAAAVRDRLGVEPEAVPTFKALAGDPSDNIPGLPGIGAKTAARLIAEYVTLEEMYAHLDELSARLANTLSAGRQDAELFRSIATIVTDLPLPIHMSALPVPSFTGGARVREILNVMGAPRP